MQRSEIMQISIYELLPEEPATEHVLSGKVYEIPNEVWQNRCQACVHKNSGENIPCDMTMIERPMFESVLPCRILRLCMFDIAGECKSFAPKYGTPSICDSCQYNNIFHPGYCMKEDHAPKRRVYMSGVRYGTKDDYYSDHRLSVCDDYVFKSGLFGWV